MREVFVDTSGFYALLDASDPFHAEARTLFHQAGESAWALLTTNYVVQESWALIQNRLGWAALEAWHDQVLPHCRVIWVDETSHRMGEARCFQARERRLSLTDCISLEIMRARGLREAIARDEHFAKAGIRAPR